MKRTTTTQHGFTMIELMIAMALGLIIIAAAVGVYLANYRNLATQRSGSEMQSASMFGVQPLEARLRLANLGSDVTNITDATADSGIVLESANATEVTADNLRSNTGTGPSNTGTSSDQLTLQFKNVTAFDMYDCEGNAVASNHKSIERYFVRNDANGNLVLACDAGVFDASGTLSNFGDNGVDLISDVDLFRYLIGVQTITNGGTTIRFYTADDYKALSAANKPQIVMIRAGIIARGSTPMTGSEGLSEFTLLGQTETINGGVSTNFVRNTFETTTLLRNARSISYQTTDTGININ